jgi:hypothetical protein
MVVGVVPFAGEKCIQDHERPLPGDFVASTLSSAAHPVEARIEENPPDCASSVSPVGCFHLVIADDLPRALPLTPKKLFLNGADLSCATVDRRPSICHQ